jgi:NADPH:quinone reductase-like Zn-dependent oxidoreductase
MKSYQLQTNAGLDALAVVDVPEPSPGPRQILVRVHATSLNYRDLRVATQAGAARYPMVPLSDGAGEVVACGTEVTRFKPGDRVAACFFQAWFDGAVSAAVMASAMGGAIDGMLREYALLDESAAVRFPAHLSYTEAATLPCAALTAWHALVPTGHVRAGDTVLVLGTGGVSVFALQFAKLHGARVIATSSSDAKLERMRSLGADATINYRDRPKWAGEVLALTGGHGVDHVVEVGGAGTLTQSLQAARIGGRVSLIGILTGLEGQVNPLLVMRKSITLQGIYVGSTVMFEAMNRAIDLHRLTPVIDRVFPFAEAKQAYLNMQAAAHFGKLVIAH